MTSQYNGTMKLLRDARLITLVVAAIVIALVVGFLGHVLIPFIIAVVVAYFLEGGIDQCMRRRLSRRISVAIIFGVFLLVYVVGMLGPLQLAVRQSIRLVRIYPAIVADIKTAIAASSVKLSGLITDAQRDDLLTSIADRIDDLGAILLGATIPAVGQATNWAFIMLIVPVLVFFLLMDKEAMKAQIRHLLPRDIQLVQTVWHELEGKLANYVRGKLWEIIILTVVTTIVFMALGFDYAFLMGLATGFSVLVPYVGAALVTFPIAVLGYTQWGFTWDLAWLIIAYGIIQFIDGNILAAYIFSEAVKIQPFYILLAVVVFGSLFGFWGVFLAIPLATVFKTIVVTLLEFRDELAGDTQTAPSE